MNIADCCEHTHTPKHRGILTPIRNQLNHHSCHVRLFFRSKTNARTLVYVRSRMHERYPVKRFRMKNACVVVVLLKENRQCFVLWNISILVTLSFKSLDKSIPRCSGMERSFDWWFKSHIHHFSSLIISVLCNCNHSL